MNFAHPDGRDYSIIYYYKNYVNRHMAQVRRYVLSIWELSNIAVVYIAIYLLHY